MTDPFPTDATLQVIPWQMLMNYYLVSLVEAFTAVKQHVTSTAFKHTSCSNGGKKSSTQPFPKNEHFVGGTDMDGFFNPTILAS